MSILIQMKRNKFYKLLFIMFIALFLVACTRKSNDVKEPEVPEPDVEVIEPEPIEISYSLLGTDYTLPTSYQTLKEEGWVLEDDPDFVLESNQFIKNRFVRNGPYILDLSFYNPSDEGQTLEESLVSSITSENRTFGDDEASDIIVHGFINFDTDIETVIEELGDYELEESAQFKTYTFQHNNLSKTEIKIEQDTESMRWIVVENFNVD